MLLSELFIISTGKQLLISKKCILFKFVGSRAGSHGVDRFRCSRLVQTDMVHDTMASPLSRTPDCWRVQISHSSRGLWCVCGGVAVVPKWAQVFLKLRQFRIAHLACLSEEARKAAGPFYLRGKVKDSTRGRCVTCCGLSHYSFTKTLLILSRALDWTVYSLTSLRQTWYQGGCIAAVSSRASSQQKQLIASFICEI